MMKIKRWGIEKCPLCKQRFEGPRGPDKPKDDPIFALVKHLKEAHGVD